MQSLSYGTDHLHVTDILLNNLYNHLHVYHTDTLSVYFAGLIDMP